MKSILKEINGDVEKLNSLLENDGNFAYSITEGGYYTNDGVVVSINRSPYKGSLYAISKNGEFNIDKWANYIIELFNNNGN